MNIKNLLFVLLAAYFATFLRVYIDNNFVISIFGSFFFGFIIAKRLKKTTNTILLTGFCSSFTSFSGFINYFYQLISQQDFIKIFLFLNISLIANLLMMYCGFQIGRKIN